MWELRQFRIPLALNEALRWQGTSKQPARPKREFLHRGRSRGWRQHQLPILWRGGALWEKSWQSSLLTVKRTELDRSGAAQTSAVRLHEPQGQRIRYQREAALRVRRSTQSFVLPGSPPLRKPYFPPEPPRPRLPLTPPPRPL